MLWDWDTKKLLKSLPLNIEVPDNYLGTFQLSFNPFDVEGHQMVLTGPNAIFKYVKKDLDNNLSVEFSGISSVETGRQISENYTCHAWSAQTGHILICTDKGEMVVCEKGVFRAYLLDAPFG